jgi:hypothetical protein
MSLLVPLNAGKFLNSRTTGGFSRRAQLHEVSLVMEMNEVVKGGHYITDNFGAGLKKCMTKSYSVLIATLHT